MACVFKSTDVYRRLKLIFYFIFELINKLTRIFTMKLLEGKVAIITGASRGIGSGIAKVFAEQGANVAFTYSSSVESAMALESELNALGIKAKGYKSNAADFNEAQKLVDDVIAEFGTIDVLINNAGITKDNLLMRMSEEDFDKVIEINLKSVFNMTKAVQKIMLKNRKGSIVNMSSVVGVKGNAGQANYAASKAGVIGLVQSTAPILKKGITINAVAPGFIETAMTAAIPFQIREAGRLMNSMSQGGQPVDVAEAIAWFANPASGGLNGNVVRVCGQSLLGA